MTTRTFIIAAFLTLCHATNSLAHDVWAVQGKTDGATTAPCALTAWTGDIVFQNTTATAAVIALRGLSDGSPAGAAGVTSFSIPAGRTVTLQSMIGSQWQPNTFPAIWITHLDVPAGVLLESRLEIGYTDPCVLTPPSRTPIYGKVSFPLFHALVPAGERHVDVGTDLGAVDARVNVGLYNGGTANATAAIELRRACDDALIGQQSAIVPANSFRQVSMTPAAVSDPTSVCPSGGAAPYVAYTVVVVDQPSLTFTSMLANQMPADNRPVIKVPYAITLSTKE